MEEGGGWGEKDQRSEERKRVLLSQSRSYKTGNRVNKNLSKNINFQTNLFFLILRRNGGRKREGRGSGDGGMGEWGGWGKRRGGEGDRGGRRWRERRGGKGGEEVGKEKGKGRGVEEGREKERWQ